MRSPQHTIASRLAFGFSLIAALILAVAATGAIQTGRIAERIAQVNGDYYPKTVLADAVKSNLNVIERAIRNLLFVTVAADIDRELAAIATAQAGIGHDLERFARLDGRGAQANEKTASESGQLLAAVTLARRQYQPALEAFLQLVKKGDVEQARDLNLPDMGPLQQRYFGALDQLIAYQGRQMDGAGRAAEHEAVLARTVMLSLAGVAIALALTIGLSVTRRISGPLRAAVGLALRVADGDLSSSIDPVGKGAPASAATGSDETGQLLAALAAMNDSLARTVSEVRGGTDAIDLAAREIASGNAELSVRTQAQASSLEQTSRTLEQLTDGVRANARSAAQAQQLALAASQIAGSGDAMVARMTGNMDDIAQAAARIGDITGVIDGIAFQTNILALNAAVEAARAGEHGRGFAVVASEVRTLAQRSAVAAREIRQLTGNSSLKVEEGTRLAADAGATMRRMLGAVQALTQAMDDIATASEQQRGGIEHVNRALVRMDGMTQQNAALVEEAAAAAATLQLQAQSLSEAVAVFRLGGSDSAARVRAAGARPESASLRAPGAAQQLALQQSAMSAALRRNH